MTVRELMGGLRELTKKDKENMRRFAMRAVPGRPIKTRAISTFKSGACWYTTYEVDTV